MNAIVVLLTALAAAGAHSRTHEPLRVEARGPGGEDLPRLSQAVSRALMATGTAVVMGASSDEPCASCLYLVVTEQAPGRYRLETRQAESMASTTFTVSKDAALFEQARALAIEARLLIDSVPSKPTEVSRATAPKRESAPRSAPVRAVATPPVEAPAPMVPPAPVATPVSSPVRREADPDAVVVTPLAPPSRESALPAAVAPMVNESKPATVAAPTPTLEPQAPKGSAAIKPNTEPTTARPTPPETSVTSAEKPKSVPESSPRVWPWVATSVGVGLGVAAGTCAYLARSHYVALDDRQQSLASAQAHRDDGSRYQTAAFILGGAGVAALTAGVVGLVKAPSKPAKTSVAVAPVNAGLILFAQGTL